MFGVYYVSQYVVGLAVMFVVNQHLPFICAHASDAVLPRSRRGSPVSDAHTEMKGRCWFPTNITAKPRSSWNIGIHEMSGNDVLSIWWCEILVPWPVSVRKQSPWQWDVVRTLIWAADCRLIRELVYRTQINRIRRQCSGQLPVCDACETMFLLIVLF